jgi:hypothetical protein
MKLKSRVAADVLEAAKGFRRLKASADVLKLVTALCVRDGSLVSSSLRRIDGSRSHHSSCRC